MKKYVVGFMFSEDRQWVALIRKNRPDWQAGKLNGIGGKIEEGEIPVDALIREFREETGVETTINDWMMIGKIEGQESRVFIGRCFSDKVFDVETTTDEVVSLHRVDPIPNGTVPNLRVIIPALLLPEMPCIYLTYYL